jgi:hypothetical protein
MRTRSRKIWADPAPTRQSPVLRINPLMWSSTEEDDAEGFGPTCEGTAVTPMFAPRCLGSAAMDVDATHAPDAAYEPLARHHEDKQVANITYAIALMNACNRAAIGFHRGPEPDPAKGGSASKPLPAVTLMRCTAHPSRRSAPPASPALFVSGDSWRLMAHIPTPGWVRVGLTVPTQSDRDLEIASLHQS